MSPRKKWLLLGGLLLAAGSAAAAEIGSLNTTAADNVARFPESMALSALNDAARELEAIIARWARDTIDGCPAASGTNTITVSANRTISSYYDGLTLCSRITAANSGAVTVNVDSVGGFKLVTPNNAQLSGGELQPDARIFYQWSEPASAWKLIALPATGFTDPLTTNGDLIVRSGGSTTRLAKGASGTVLMSGNTDSVWTTLSNWLDAIVGTSSGSMLARSSTGWTLVAAGTTGYHLTAQTNAVPVWNPPVVQAIYYAQQTTTFGTSGTTFIDVPGLSVTLTPKSSSSKFKLEFSGVASNDSASGRSSFLRLAQDNTGLNVGTSVSSRVAAGGGSQSGTNVQMDANGMMWIATPATTASITFKVQIRAPSDGGTAWIGRGGTDTDSGTAGRFGSSLIVTEFQ